MVQYFWCQTLAIVFGYVSDLIFGDPHWLYHPVRLIGKLVNVLEKLLFKSSDTDKAKFLKGMFLTVITVVVTGCVSAAILFVCYRISMKAGLAAETIMCYQILAVKSLKTESMKVYKTLKNEGIEQAREAVSMIVGRDTKQLDEHGIVRAAVETVAENTSDGVIAPLFYMLFFGAVGGFVYKAINTLDSMIGYKNDRYMYFGRFAAKADDCVNFIPARIGGFFLVLSAGAAHLLSALKRKNTNYYSMKNAWKIFCRDRKKHSSPNSAQTEAACAGALMVALSGDNYYFGKLVRKPCIGEAIRPLEVEDIKRSNVLLYLSAFFMVLLVFAVRAVIMFYIFVI